MNITVYCGASLGKNGIYEEIAKKMGAWIAENGHTLVYGGGNTGLMGKVADAVLEKGGQVIGVIPTFLKEWELAHHGITELHEVKDMSERKKMMFDLGDAFIALPGGAGTLEEIVEVISWSRLGQNDKPCILFDVDQFYHHLGALFQHMVKEGFLTAEDTERILFADDFQRISDFIANYQPPKPRSVF